MSQQTNFAASELDRAIRHHQAGELDAARAIYRRILDADPNHPDALKLSGVIAHQAGNQETAIRLIEQAISANSTNASYYNNLGEAYRAFGRPRDAIEAYERALRIHPGDLAASNNLGLAFQSLQRYEEARAAYERALAIAPDDYAGAEKAWLRATRLQPDLGDAYDGLGQAYRYLDRLEEALAAHQKAVVCAPGTALFREEFGTTLIRAGEYPRAVEELRAHFHNPHPPMDQTMRGGTQTPNNLFQNPTGVWSTIIKESGYDRSHVHNEGWMSGTYYAKIPDFDETQLNEHDGCIQFGEPNSLYASECNAPRRIIPPWVGTVVLFPSYYWHGVQKFDRNGVRHSVSYDLI